MYPLLYGHVEKGASRQTRMERPSLLDLQLPKLYQLDNRLRTTFDVQFLHHIRNMVANGFLADEQLLSDISCCFVLYQQLEHLSFTMRQ
jgi:hypothetical protein